MSKLRHIMYPECPSCGNIVYRTAGNLSNIHGIIYGNADDDEAVLRCERCGKQFEVRCTIKFSVIGGENNE